MGLERKGRVFVVGWLSRKKACDGMGFDAEHAEQLIIFRYQQWQAVSPQTGYSHYFAHTIVAIAILKESQCATV